MSTSITHVIARGVSMEPSMHHGDTLSVEVNPKVIQVGDIIVFLQNTRVIAHRVIREVRKHNTTYFMTKGDNNEHPDGFVAQHKVIGKVIRIQPTIWMKFTNRLYLFLRAKLSSGKRFLTLPFDAWIANTFFSLRKILCLYMLMLICYLITLLTTEQILSKILEYIAFVFTAFLAVITIQRGYIVRLSRVVSDKQVLDVLDRVYILTSQKNSRSLFLPNGEITYSRFHTQSTAWAMFQELYPLFRATNPPKRALILGFGTGGFAYQLMQLFPYVQVVGIEKNKKIIQLTNKYFFPLFQRRDSVTLLHADAYTYAKDATQKFDIIFIDIFLHTTLHPKSLSTDFLCNLKKLTSSKGIVCMNFGIIRETNMSRALRTYTTFYPRMRVFLMGKNVIGVHVPRNLEYLHPLCGVPII